MTDEAQHQVLDMRDRLAQHLNDDVAVAWQIAGPSNVIAALVAVLAARVQQLVAEQPARVGEVGELIRRLMMLVEPPSALQ